MSPPPTSPPSTRPPPSTPHLPSARAPPNHACAPVPSPHVQQLLRTPPSGRSCHPCAPPALCTSSFLCLERLAPPPSSIPRIPPPRCGHHRRQPSRHATFTARLARDAYHTRRSRSSCAGATAAPAALVRAGIAWAAASAAPVTTLACAHLALSTFQIIATARNAHTPPLERHLACASRHSQPPAPQHEGQPMRRQKMRKHERPMTRPRGALALNRTSERVRAAASNGTHTAYIVLYARTLPNGWPRPLAPLLACDLWRWPCPLVWGGPSAPPQSLIHSRSAVRIAVTPARKNGPARLHIAHIGARGRWHHGWHRQSVPQVLALRSTDTPKLTRKVRSVRNACDGAQRNTQRTGTHTAQ